MATNLARRQFRVRGFDMRREAMDALVAAGGSAAASAAEAAAGAEVLVEGTVGADGAVMYVDPGAGPGHVIELLQNMTGADAIFQMIKDAGKDWDGSDPLRRLG